MSKRIFIDSGLLNYICKDTEGSLWDSFLDVAAASGNILDDRRACVQTDPLLFLEFIGHGRIIEQVPQELSSHIKELGQSLFDSKEDVCETDIYQTLDKMYSKSLNVCQSLQVLKPASLLEKYSEQGKFIKGKGGVLLKPLICGSYLDSLQNDPDLTCLSICQELAWQLLMINLRSAFNKISSKSNPALVLKLFEPLMASVHHLITSKTIQPNIFRLVESMYLSSIKTQKARMSQEEWSWIQDYENKYKTCAKGDLCDSVYLDKAMVGHLDFGNERIQLPVTVFTCDESKQVYNRLKIFRNILEKFKSEVEGWELIPQYSCKVVCVKVKTQCSLGEIVQHACSGM